MRVVLEVLQVAANHSGSHGVAGADRANRLGVAAQTKLLGHRVGILAKALIIVDGAIACVVNNGANRLGVAGADATTTPWGREWFRSRSLASVLQVSDS
jgi:hypothetical protein